MLSEHDKKCLADAKKILQNPNFLMKTLTYVGMPLEKGVQMLPARVSQAIIKVSRSALTKSLQAAVMTMDEKKVSRRPSRALQERAALPVARAAAMLPK